MFYGNELYDTFFLYFDLAIPFAIGFDSGMLTLTESGEAMVNNAWDAFCDLIQIDSYGEYADLSSMISFAGADE
jgi:hypothetical protein